MHKKTQVTIFIILGLVIVISLMLIFALRENILNTLSRPSVPLEIQGVYDFVQDCLKSTSEEAVYLIGQQGGYYKPQEPMTSAGVPYYFFNNQLNIPKKDRIISEISNYINEGLQLCTNNFTDFPEFEITQDNVISNVKLKGDKIIINVNYPLNINKGKYNYELKEFNNELNFRLNTIYDVAEAIVNEQYKNPKTICLTCLSKFGVKKDLFINMRLYENDTIIYNIVDPNSLLDINLYNQELYGYGQYNYIFAIQY